MNPTSQSITVYLTTELTPPIGHEEIYLQHYILNLMLDNRLLTMHIR